MSNTTLSSRQLNQDASRANKAAYSGPTSSQTVAGQRMFCSLSAIIKKMSGHSTTIADLLAMTGYEDVAFDILASRELAQAASLS